MISYTKQELQKFFEKSGAEYLEIYAYTDTTNNLHTDCIDSAYDSNGAEITSIEQLPDGDIKCDWQVMDAEDYSHSILANSCVSFSDIFAPDDKVFVIVLDYWFATHMQHPENK